MGSPALLLLLEEISTPTQQPQWAGYLPTTSVVLLWRMCGGSAALDRLGGAKGTASSVRQRSKATWCISPEVPDHL